MMGKTHQVIGVTVSATGLILIGIPPTSPAFFAGVLIGWVASVLPDIDGDPNSGDPAVRKMLGVGHNQTDRNIGKSTARLFKSRNITDVIVRLAGLVIALFAKVIALIINIFARLVPHRGMTHWGITWFGLTALLLLLALSLQETAVETLGYSAMKFITFPFFLGYGSHILADMATRSGIVLLWPVSRKSLHLLPKPLRILTGSWQETVFLAIWVGVSALSAYLIYILKFEGTI